MKNSEDTELKNFDRFGVMIDCSRNAVMSVPTLKRFFGILAKMGYDCAMLYTEDTYEIDGEPLFGYKRGRYTQAELREIDEYASGLGIELIPCIQTLGHMNAAFRWNRYKGMRDCCNILLAGDERVYELIDKMFSSLSKCVKSRKIHIGMDEAYLAGLGKYLEIHGYRNRFEVLCEHLQRVCDIAKKYGYETLMWEDMFFRCLPSGYNAGTKASPVVEFPAWVREAIPENATMVYWDYYGDCAEKYANMIESSKNLSDKVWFAGGVWIWHGLTSHNRLSIRRNALALPECKKGGVKNVLMTLWGDNGGECSMFYALPGLMHAAAVAEGMDEAGMKAKFREITGEDYDDMLALDLPNYIYGEDIDIGCANYSKNRLYNDPLIGLLDANNENPVDSEIFAKYAARLDAIADKETEFSYLYRTQAALCRALEVKFDLGNVTRERYLALDREGVRRIAEESYPLFLTRLDAFYRIFRDKWNRDNKPYGFEIQDIRIGGLVRRFENCRERLLEWCDGKAESIPELDEPVINADRGDVAYWNDMASPAVMAEYIV